jgi:hypothetical protein
MDGRISNYMQVASLRRYHLMGGSQDGLEVIDCDNGKLRFLINVSKACDVMQVYHEGQNVSFISKNGFTKREIAFLNRFEGGMVYTCGLDNAGRREGYEMHGTFHSTPAEILRAECNEGGIVIEALIRNSALFGQNLVMKRRITSAIGRLRFAFFNSALIEVAMIQPSYANAAAAIPAKTLPKSPPVLSAVCVKASMVLPLIKPTMVPTTTMIARGISLIMVALTWNLPAIFGERILIAYARQR